MHRRVHLFVLVGLLSAACAREAAVTGGAVTEPPGGVPELNVAPPDSGPRPALVATSDVPRIPAFRRPGAARPFVRFDHPGDFGLPRVFLVDLVRDDWLHVYLPMRPNGSRGWVRARHVTIGKTGYRIVVDTGRNRLSLWDGNRVVIRRPVATGTGGTPTPTGRFYVTLVIRPTDPGGPYGPFAFGLSAYSEVLFSFAGGDGQVAIHGTNDPSSIGSDVSHGCIRLDNASVRRLQRLIPLGTPVVIRP